MGEKPQIKSKAKKEPEDPSAGIAEERFAIFLAQGKPVQDAYRMAHDTVPDGWQDAARKLAAKPKIRQRVKELQCRFQEGIEERYSFTKEDAVKYLMGILSTPVGQITENHPYAQVAKPGPWGMTLQMPSKVSAMRELREMLPGWNARKTLSIPELAEMTALLKAVRNGEPLPAPAKVIELQPPSEHP